MINPVLLALLQDNAFVLFLVIVNFALIIALYHAWSKPDVIYTISKQSALDIYDMHYKLSEWIKDLLSQNTLKQPLHVIPVDAIKEILSRDAEKLHADAERIKAEMKTNADRLHEDGKKAFETAFASLARAMQRQNTRSQGKKKTRRAA